VRSPPTAVVVRLKPGEQESQASTLQVRTLRTKHLDIDDGDTYYIVVRHTASPCLAEDERYALVVALEDEERQNIDLYASLSVRLPARVRLRS
jgi:hypothetical protein